MKKQIIQSIRLFVSEILDIRAVYSSLNIKEKAEFGKIIAFGLFINSGYGALHGSILDIPVLFLTIYAIMKLIKLERRYND